MTSQIISTFKSKNSLCPDIVYYPNAIWNLNYGHLSTFNSLYDPKTPLSLRLPLCALRPNSDYSLNITVWFSTTSIPDLKQIISIHAQNETFRSFIQTNRELHPETVDLTLSGYIIYNDGCELRAQGQILYFWTCYKMNGAGQTSSCLDSSGLFNVLSNTSDLVVPKAYFQSGDELLLTLFIRKNNLTANSSVVVDIEGPETMIVQINCTSTIVCQQYIENLDYEFTATVYYTSPSGAITKVPSSSYQNLNFTWTVGPKIPFVSFQNQMKIPANTLNFDPNTNFINIQLNVTNLTHVGRSGITLPINRPPSSGSVFSFPTSGIPLSTIFNISAINWQDLNNPLTYQYYYSFSATDDFTPMLYKPKYQANLTSILPGPSNGGPVYIQVQIIDLYGAKTTACTQVQIYPINDSVQQSLDEYNALLNASMQAGPLITMQVAAMISKQLADLESQLTKNITSPVCPLCSGHGVCPTGKSACVCDSGWGLPDCSLSQATIAEIVSLKQSYLQDLNSSYLTLQATDVADSVYDITGQKGDPDDDLLMYQVLSESSQNVYFNTNQSLTSVDSILKSTLDALSANNTLTSQESQLLTNILSNMLNYAVVYDCNKETNFTHKVEDELTSYLEQIGNSSLLNNIAGENATVIETQNIDMFFQTISACKLSSSLISTGSDPPVVTINFYPNETTDCSNAINVGFYAFSDNILKCNQNASNITTKGSIAITMSPQRPGSSMQPNINITINFPGGNKYCPNVCSIDKNGLCVCDNLSPFDLKNQVKAMFATSNLQYLSNFRAVKSFQFWKTSPFWATSLFTIWFLITLIVVTVVNSKYDIIEKFNRDHDFKKKLRYILVAFVVIFCD